MQFAKRLQPLQFNVFAEMDRAKAIAKAAGQQLIDLSLGSSDLPTEAHIIEAIAQSLGDPSTHGYLLFNGTQAFRSAAANWYEQKFGIKVDPETEVLPLIGSQEGTAHLPLAVLNPGDFALLLDPGYPSHAGGVYLASGQIYPMPLREENNFLPVFSEIPAPVLAQSRMMVLSYPHNPTSAIAPLSFFQEAVAFCQQHNLVLVHDFPYVDLVFEETGGQGDKETRGQGDKETRGQGGQGGQGDKETRGQGDKETRGTKKNFSPSPPIPRTPAAPLGASIFQGVGDKSVAVVVLTFCP